jgi:hypothetical protein
MTTNLDLIRSGINEDYCGCKWQWVSTKNIFEFVSICNYHKRRESRKNGDQFIISYRVNKEGEEEYAI